MRKLAPRARVALAFLLAILVTAACAATRTPIDPRFLAVHNAFAAMGMAQVGPVQQGSLVEGREARLSLDLAAQCTTLVAIGGDGVRDLDLSVVDGQGTVLARDTTHDPQAVLRVCVDAPGAYSLVVKMAAGSGEFLAATWTGGGTAGPAGSAAIAASGRGNCDAPITIGPGTINGNTSIGESENSCSNVRAEGKELVYRLEVPTRKKLTIEVRAHFDAVLYVRKEVCDSDDEEYEVKCNDDDGNDERASRIDAVVDPGTYFVFVDGYQDSGTFVMNVTTTDVPSLADVCRQARPLTTSGTATGTTTSSYDHVHASCGDDAKANDVPYRFDLGQRSRVRFTHHSDDFTPVIHVRSVCTDDQTEVGCYDDSSAVQDDEAVFVGVLDPGSYAVFADGSDEDQSGRYTLDAEVGPEAGSGTTGDACADAVPLPPNDASIDGDTFTAKDDIAGKCGGTGAADVVYRIDLPKRSRIVASLDREEGAGGGNSDAHVFVLQRTCADKNSELACGSSVDEILQPGTYYLTVDGAKPDRFGKFTIAWSVRDVSGQENACKAAPSLVDGQTVSGNTTGGSDKFATSCGGERIGSSNDKLYKIVLTSRQRVRLALSTPLWDGVLAIRKACLDPSGSTSSRQAEMACNNDAEDSHHARIETTLDAGTYYVLVDGHRGGQDGAYTLEYKVVH